MITGVVNADFDPIIPLSILRADGINFTTTHLRQNSK